ncbi:MAG: prephenate dehydrogenase/arogenate dehydrogenase family protein, partial [Gammaproteobacteria bacterium]|nr:prephenate dehydrogenase/arogenate dehydrogenase family protein [Gammaproteobacteria bacterium]
MVAYTLVNYLEARPDAEDIFNYAAAGFYDFTRIASSSPAMWTDICLANREELLTSIDGFGQLLKELRSLISENDEEALYGFLERAKHLRDFNSVKK